MTYIDSAGNTRQGSKPMSKNPVDLLAALFWGIINFLWAFVASMCNVSRPARGRAGTAARTRRRRVIGSLEGDPKLHVCVSTTPPLPAHAGAPDQDGVVGRRDQAL
jgi:hypothetical protein